MSISQVFRPASLPQNYMFKEMRAALGIPRSVDILDHIHSLSTDVDDTSAESAIEDQQSSNPESNSTFHESQPPSQLLSTPSTASPPPTSPQARAVAKIQAIERRAMTSQRPQPGLQELMAYLRRRNIQKALCTRNFPAPVHHLLESFLKGDEYGAFEPIITRDSEGIQPKPSPEGLWRIAYSWRLDQDIDGLSDYIEAHGDGGLDPLELAKRHLGSGLIMVGDSLDDMAAGYRAGAATVLLANEENEELAQHEYTGLSIRRLDELVVILEKGFAEEAKTGTS